VVHYSLVGSDTRVRCLIYSDGNNTEIKTYKWDYTNTKTKNKTSKNIEKSVTFKNPREIPSKNCIYLRFQILQSLVLT